MSTDTRNNGGPTITYEGRTYQRFIPYPDPVEDGTLRCIFCGQIDEEWGHDIKLCCGSEHFDEAALAALTKAGGEA